MPVWVARTRRVIEYAPTNPISLARYQWETRLGDLISKRIVHVHMIDESSIVFNASRGAVPLLLLPKSKEVRVAVERFSGSRGAGCMLEVGLGWSLGLGGGCSVLVV